MPTSLSCHIQHSAFQRAIALLLVPVCLATAMPRYLSAEVIGPDKTTAVPLISVTAPAKEEPIRIKINRTLPEVANGSSSISFSENPTDQEIAMTRFFAEPMIPFNSQTSLEENNALAEGILKLAKEDDFSGIELFLNHYPQSRWNVALLTNLGLVYRHHGYWTKALAVWESAWSQGKNEKQPQRKLLVDRAVAQLGELKARLGRVYEVESLVKEVGPRQFEGAAGETWAGAKSSLALMKNEPDKSFRCGPLAVGKLLTAINAFTPESSQLVFNSTSTDHGTSLLQVRDFAKKVGLNYQMAYRKAGAEVLFPSVINWKAGHFAAITRAAGSQFVIEDTTFSDIFTPTKEALDAEASGYFLVRSGDLPEGWRTVSNDEGAKVWGKGATPPNSPPPPHPQPCNCKNNGHAMAVYNLDASRASLMMFDTPIFYTPPRGPEMEFTVSYMQLDAAPSTYQNYPNLGPKWSFNWMAFIIDDTSNANTKSYGPGGGSLTYKTYTANTSSTGSFAPQLLDQAVLKRTSATSYQKTFPDGSIQKYGLADSSSPKRIFLTESFDPTGNKMTYTYDANFRLAYVADAIGQVTTIIYASNSFFLADNVTPNPDFYKVKTVSDPFGRSAIFDYDASGHLWKITDTVGIVSEFTYGSGDFITKLKTPYGNTNFALTETDANNRYIVVTDQQNAHERVEYRYQTYRTCFFWNKKAYEAGPTDASKAKSYTWLHGDVGISDVLDHEKNPLENQYTYYEYPNQLPNAYPGTSNRPLKTYKTLDDGSMQSTTTETNSIGKLTRLITPGNANTPSRTTLYKYESTGFDLIAVYQQNPAGLTDVNDDPAVPAHTVKADLLATYTYDTGGKHLVLTATDASRRTTTYTYTNFGQILTVTNPKNETTTFNYYSADLLDGQGYVLNQRRDRLSSIDGPTSTTTHLAEFDYDAFGRNSSIKDSEGYTKMISYDAIGGISTKTLNRPVKVQYPDATTEEIIYDRLNVQFVKDRLNRWTQNQYDPLRRLTDTTDPQGRLTHYDWCGCGALEGITDPAGNHTTWMRDIQGRLTQKIYPDTKTTTYGYENATSRLKTITDAKNQVINYTYNIDNTLKQITYTDTAGNALNPATPTVNFTYDPYYMRQATMVDGIGTTIYAYNPVPAAAASPTLGSGRLATVDGPFAADTISYGYDELGRNLNRQIDGTNNTTTYAYDALGRMSGVINPLGSFTYNYVNLTQRLASALYPNGQSTSFGYFNNSGDERLQQIKNLTATSQTLSQFDYTYAATGRIDTWTQNNNGLPSANVTSFGYDKADQLTSASRSGASAKEQSWRYDLAGNRKTVQDGANVTSYTANNLNQLTDSSSGGQMRFAGAVSKPSTVTVGGSAATVDATNHYEGFAQVNPGQNNQVHIVATNPQGETTNRYVNVSPALLPATTFAYDLNGNLLSYGPSGSPVATYTYDAADRLKSIVQSVNTYSFDYDGLNRRVREKLNGTEIKHWVWNDLEQCEERDASNSVTKRFYLQGFTTNASSPAVKFFYNRDHLGSIREVTDSTQTVRARYDYDAYGVRSANLITFNPIEADFGYTGHYYHAGSGLHMAPYRFYNASLGRWLSRDPIGENGGINLYGYVNNYPVNAIDRDGRNPLIIAGAVFGAAFGAGADLGYQLTKDGGRNNTSGLPCIDWGSIGRSALFGGVGGALTGATLGLGGAFWGGLGAGYLTGGAVGAAGF